LAKFLQKFLDRETVAKQLFSDRPDAEEFKKFIFPSQLEKIHGGSAPNVTQFWPPTMPEIVELNEDLQIPKLSLVPRAKYIDFVKQNPGLTVMPKQMRLDLDPHPIDV
jgi:hypothetical protein